MTDTVVLYSTCAGGALCVTAIYSLCRDLLGREQMQIRNRLKHEFQPQDKQSSQKSPLFRDLKMLQETQNQSRSLSGWWNRFEIRVEQSGLLVEPIMIVLNAVALGAVVLLATWFVSMNVILAIGFGLASMAIPFFVVEFFRQRRRTQLCQQLPDAFDQMRRSIRAGQSLTTAMQQIAVESTGPLAEEFAMCCQQHELGLSQVVALQDLARRIDIMEFRLFVVAALVQREVGGNFAEILGSLSTVVRQRVRLASKVKSSTAEGRMQAVVLAMLPIIAGLIMAISNFEYIRLLLDRPRIVAAIVLSELIGVIWIRRIVNFDY